MNSLKMTMLQYLIGAFVAQLNEATVKRALVAIVGQVRKYVQTSETTMDDLIILPILDAIEDALKLD